MNQARRRFRLVALTAALVAGCDPEGTLGPVETDEPVTVRAYEQGTRLFLETRQGSNVARIGADRIWGGSIFDAELNGVNMVNIHDPMGREIQISLYDGNHTYDNCAGCRMWGWNPVQGGDRDGNNGLVTAGWVEESSFYIRARPNHWHPQILGARYGTPVRSDIVVEQRISAVPGHPFAFRVEYRITHEGTDSHAPSFLQEFPAVYVSREFPRFIHYSGRRPWTGERAVESPLPVLNTPRVKRVYTPERWAAFVNDAGQGLTIYTPGAFPYTVPGFFPGEHGGPEAPSTGYTYSFNPFGLGPGQVVEGEVYLILGNYRKAREIVYELHRQIPVKDISAPVGGIDVAEVRPGGHIRVEGWAYDNASVDAVEILVDERPVGRATLGLPRPDVVGAWPGAPSSTGFRFLLDPHGLAPGDRVIKARAVDPSGNRAEWKVTAHVPG